MLLLTSLFRLLNFKLLRDFDFQLLNPQSPWTRRVHIVYHISDMWVRVTEREKNQV